ncbi:MAG: hypothetical protein HOM25_12015 [Rhodospirillaceae bacterium]|jgi:hypothetical protein|nr:hypothetical protein [Rhodospirillaceae bacterium]MBT5665647.1 hypothetical protein [Rhodospirillaceae bacterium]MBT5808971.1 hypothetical protein [Rhodospirillaceae bacterium]
MLSAANTAHTVVVKHGAGNLFLSNGSDLALDTDTKSVLLRRAGINFYEVTRSGIPSYILLTHEEADTTDGGATTAGSWQIRTVNTKTHDPDGVVVSLAANVFTLPAGTYETDITALFAGQNGHWQMRLYDTTGAATILGPGMSAQEGTINTQICNTNVFLKGIFTIAVQSAIRLEYFASVAVAGNGQGDASAQLAGMERYVEIMLRKVA